MSKFLNILFFFVIFFTDKVFCSDSHVLKGNIEEKPNNSASLSLKQIIDSLATEDKVLNSSIDLISFKSDRFKTDYFEETAPVEVEQYITNTFGMVGYINTPSAKSMKEGTIAFSVNRDNPDRKLLLTASPFDWLDANLFYVDITGKSYGNGFNQSYKDKGFSFKLNIAEILQHRVALGFNDMAGTGFYNSEYLVFTRDYDNYEFSYGLGWGSFANGLKLKNPFTYFHNSFESRSNTIKNRGGSFDLNNYFSGKEMSFFFGGSLNISNNLRLIFELDPFKSDRFALGKDESQYNFGLWYQYRNISFKTSYKNNDHLEFQISLQDNFLDFNGGANARIQSANSYEDLNKILQANNIGLKAIRKDNKSFHIATRNNSYFNSTFPSAIIIENIKDLSRDSKIIALQHDALGMEMVEYIYKNGTKIDLNDNENNSDRPLNIDYLMKDNFPYINYSFSPVIRNFIASREGFYHGGLLLENNLEIILKENFIFLSNLKYSIYDNFDKLTIPPVDVYPAQVRSDIKKYLNNFDRGITIGRLELNYFKSFNRKHFLRFSGGLLEEMFGGLGVEYLYFPKKKNLGIGVETYLVKKRDYEMQFGFKEYKNFLSRLKIEHFNSKRQIRTSISYGEYLAGDEGLTIRMSRRFRNGVEFGVLASKTNVPIELYGEGSFDKGIFLSAPLGIFSSRKTLSRYEWHPLTKDPAALLNKSINLFDEIWRFRID
jgi:hypothetical protein